MLAYIVNPAKLSFNNEGEKDIFKYKLLDSHKKKIQNSNKGELLQKEFLQYEECCTKMLIKMLIKIFF